MTGRADVANSYDALYATGLVKFVQILARDNPLTCNFCFWSCKRAPLESSRSCPTKPWRYRDVARVFAKLSRIMT
jgi:hypothetical protein